MKIKIDEDKKVMKIEIPLQTPKKSKSGKTKVIAAGQGDTGQEYQGKQVYLSLNAYIKE